MFFLSWKIQGYMYWIDNLLKKKIGDISCMIYLIIFLAKIIEVTLATLRIVFISKGQRNIGFIVAIFEITIWVVLAGTVVVGITEDPIKMVAYIFGFAIGCYVGSWLEERIALGITNFNIVTSEAISQKIIKVLKENEVGFTILDAHGQKEDNKYIVAYVARNRKKDIITKLKAIDEHYFLTMSDSCGVMGGYGLKRKDH